MSKERRITAIVDSREQLPLDLSPYDIDVVVEKLEFGDYSVKYPNLKKVLAIERKSIDDFVACCGKERNRFERELQALKGYRYKAVVCEFTYRDLYDGRFRSQIKSLSVTRSLARWSINNIGFVMTGSREESARYVSDVIKVASKDIFEWAKCSIT